jgi:WD40 repeat protein
MHLKGHSPGASYVAFSPCNDRIVSCSADGTSRSWNMTTRSTQLCHLRLKDFSGNLGIMAISSDCTRIATFARSLGVSGIIVWDAETGSVLSNPFRGETPSAVAFSQDGSLIVSACPALAYNEPASVVKVWDPQTGEIVESTLFSSPAAPCAVAFSDQGQFIAAGSLRGSVFIWRLRSLNLRRRIYRGHTSAVTSITFSPQGQRVISGSRDGTIRLWDFKVAKLGPIVVWGTTVSLVCSGPTTGITSIDCSPSGTRIVSGCEGGQVWVWDAKTRQTTSGPLYGDGSAVCSVSFSPDEARFASGCRSGLICVWSI